MATYWEKLRDPRWQKRRLEIMESANWACQTCESTEKTLNVHHKIYRKGKNPWDYPDSELRCLCEDCHEIEHGWRKHLDEAIAEMDSGQLEYLVGYAHGIIAVNDLFPDGPDAESKDRSWPILSYEHAYGFLQSIRTLKYQYVEYVIANRQEFSSGDVFSLHTRNDSEEQ